MEKRFTKLVSLLLAIVMVVGMVPVSSFAAEQESATPEDTDVEVAIPSDPVDPEVPTDGTDTEASDGQEIVLGERFTCTVAEEGGVSQIPFTPETTGWYVFVSYSDYDTYGRILRTDGSVISYDDDSDVDNNFNVRAYLQAGTEYILQGEFLFDRTGSFEAALYAIEEIALDEQREVTLPTNDSSAAFSFTPAESGVYSFYVDNDSAYNSITDPVTYVGYTVAGSTQEHRVCQVELAAGNTYLLRLYNSTWQEMTVNCAVTKADAAFELVCSVDSVSGTAYSTGNIELYGASPKVDMTGLSEITWESGNADIVEIYENGTSCGYTLLAAGSTEITATVAETVFTIPVTVTALPTLTLGQEVQTQAECDNYEMQFSFTAPADGVYAFYTYHNYDEPYSLTVEVRDEAGNLYSGSTYGSWGVNELQMEMTQGDTYTVRLSTYYDGILDAYVGVVECPEVEEVVFEPASITGYVSSEYKVLYYTVYPVHANLKGMTWDSTDENVTWVNDWNDSYANYRLLSVGTATISMTVGGNSYSVPVQVLDYPVLELDTEIEVTSQNYEDDKIYAFTAPEAGVYSFYVLEDDYTLNLQLETEDGTYISSNYYDVWGSRDAQLDMEAGETCYVHFRSSTGNDSMTNRVGVVKAPAPTQISVSVGQVEKYLEEVNYWNRINVSAQPAHADVTSIEWVSGDENVVIVEDYGQYFRYKVQGLGETVIAATYGDETLMEVSVTVKAPEEISLDEVIPITELVWGSPKKFTFTPTESDVYSFYSESDDNNYRIEVSIESDTVHCDGAWHSEWGTEDAQLYMEAGTTYTLSAACYYSDRAISGSVCLTRSPDATEIQVDVESISQYLDNAWRSLSATAQPAHADMTALVWTSDNEDIVEVQSYGHSCDYIVVGTGQANIIVTAGDASYTIPVEGKEMPALEEGVPSVASDETYFTFTPSESGVYTFYQDNMWQMNMSVSLQAHDWTYGQTHASWGCDYVQATLTAGQEYKVYVYSTVGDDETVSCNVGVVKAPAVTSVTAENASISGYVSGSWIGTSLNMQPMYADLTQVTVTSSDEQVVQAHYSSGQLNYQLIAVGTAQITVTAGDATLTIPVEVKSIPSVELDEIFTVDIVTSGETVYRTFTPETSGYYVFTHIDSGEYLDSYGTVYDEDMNWLASNDDGGGNGNFEVTCYLEAGVTYHLGARLYSSGSASFDAVIRMLDATQLETGEQDVYIDPYATQSYLFTAQTSGTHVFYLLSNQADFTVTTPRGTWNSSYYDAWASTDAFFYMEAGETAILSVTTYNQHIDTTMGVGIAEAATSIVFEREQVSGYADNTGYLYFTAMPAHSVASDIQWASSDTSVVDIDGYTSYCWYRLASVGTAQISATIGDAVFTVDVTVNEIPTLEAGQPVQLTLYEGNDAKYYFTPAESGVYSFYAEDVTEGRVYLNIYDEDGQWLTSGEAFGPGFVDPARDAQYELEAGVTYLLEASPNWADELSCTLGIVKAPQVTSITLDWEEGLYDYYLPGETVPYNVSIITQPAHADMTGLEWTVTDEAVAYISYWDSGYCNLVIAGPGTAQLVVSAGDSVSASMDIHVRETPEVELGETYECVYDENYNRVQFLFTPEVSGTYHAYTAGEGSTQIWLYQLIQYEDWLDTSYMGSTGYGAEGSNALMTQQLVAGETYLYTIEDSWDVESFTFCITEPQPVTELSFVDDSVIGFPGKSWWPNYVAKPFTADTADIQLTSSDEAVVTVQEDGSALLVGAGTATLTATAASGVSATCAVTVKAPQQLTLNSEKTVTIDPELGYELFYFTPAQAGTYIVEASGPIGGKFLYAESENGIDVGNEGNGTLKIQFTAQAEEKVDIDLEAYFDFPVECTVKVTSANAATGISFTQGSAISGMVHSIQKLSVNFAPAGAAEEEITWTSDNEQVATVEYGYVTIVGAGTAVITAETESGLTAQCTVTGTEPETIVVSETKKVDVEVPGDTGVFKFVPENTTTYIVRSIGNASTSLEILDEDGNYVGAVDYALRAAYGIVGNSGNAVELEAGKTYYVRASMVSNSVGAFKVLIEEHLTVVDYEITKLPDQTECYAGGSISMSGLELKIQWSDGSFTDYSYDEGGDLGDDDLGWSTSEGSTGKEVTLYISNITRSFTVPYATKTVTAIRIIENEEFSLVEYADGEWYADGFYYYLPTDLLGAEITYSDGSTKTVDSIDRRVDGAWFESFYDSSKWEVGADDNTVTFEYMGAEVQYNVRLVASPVESITVTSAPSKVYTFGDEWYGWVDEDGSYEMDSYSYDLTGLSLTVSYTDGTSKTFTHEDIEGSEYSPAVYMDDYAIGFSDVEATVGSDNTVTVSYMGAEATYQITVVEPAVKYVQIVKAPDRLPTEAGFSSDSLGMQLKLTYTDNTTKVITVTEDNVSYSGSMYPASIITDGDLEIRVSYDRGYNGIYAYVTCGSFSSYQLIAEQSTSFTIEDIEVTAVSEANSTVELKLTYMDGTSEVLTLAPAAGAQTTKTMDSFRSVASTDKGLLSYTVWVYSDGYEVYTMDRGFYLEAPDVTVGDADGNGVVDGMDATLLLQFAAGWDVEIDEAAGDADGNGVVDGMDATLLLQYAAGWDVTLGGN